MSLFIVEIIPFHEFEIWNPEKESRIHGERLGLRAKGRPRVKSKIQRILFIIQIVEPNFKKKWKSLIHKQPLYLSSTVRTESKIENNLKTYFVSQPQQRSFIKDKKKNIHKVNPPQAPLWSVNVLFVMLMNTSLQDTLTMMC